MMLGMQAICMHNLVVVSRRAALADIIQSINKTAEQVTAKGGDLPSELNMH